MTGPQRAEEPGGGWRCGDCGTREERAHIKFCRQCGGQLTVPPPPAERRPGKKKWAKKKWLTKDNVGKALIALACIAPLLALPILLRGWETEVDGQVQVDHPALGRWTMTPGMCSSGDLWWRPFYGVHLTDGQRWLRIYDDEVVVGAGEEEVSLGESDCDRLTAIVRKGDADAVDEHSHRTYRSWSGELSADCELSGGGQLTAEVSFSNCMGDGAQRHPPPGAKP